MNKQGISAFIMTFAGWCIFALSDHYKPLPATALPFSAESSCESQTEASDTFPETTEELIVETTAEDLSYKPVLEELNFAYYYPEEEEAGNIMKSYAGKAYMELMSQDEMWMSGIYDYADLMPEQLASRMGQPRSRVLGSYNPKDDLHDPSNPETWAIHSFRNIRLHAVNGDKEKIDVYSNVAEIMSLANVYTFYKGAEDYDLFLSYARDLWEASHSYSIRLSDIYYCDGCLKEEEEEERLKREAEAEAAAFRQDSTQITEDNTEAMSEEESQISLEIGPNASLQESRRLEADSKAENATYETIISQTALKESIMDYETASQPEQQSALPSEQQTASQPEQQSALPSEQQTVSQPEQQSALPSGQQSALQPEQQSALPSGQQSALQSEQQSALQSEQQSALQPRQQSALPSGQQSASQPEQQSALQPRQQSALPSGQQFVLQSGQQTISQAGQQVSLQDSRTASKTSQQTILQTHQQVLQDQQAVLQQDQQVVLHSKQQEVSQTNQQGFSQDHQTDLQTYQEPVLHTDQQMQQTAWQGEQLASQSKQHTVSETYQQTVSETHQQTVSETQQQIVSETYQQTVSKTQQQIVSETQQHTVSEAQQQTVSEAYQQIVSETQQHTVSETQQQVVPQDPQALEMGQGTKSEDQMKQTTGQMNQAEMETGPGQNIHSEFQQTERQTESASSQESQIITEEQISEAEANKTETDKIRIGDTSFREEEDNLNTDLEAIKCPGHIDLIVQMQIRGVKETNGLFKADPNGNHEAEFEENGWQGWTLENREAAIRLASQDWNEKYGLSISLIPARNPLTQFEIEEYMGRLPNELSQTRKDLIRFALSSVGKVPYYWGGKPSAPNYSRNSFGALIAPDRKGRILKGLDCSGWVNWVYWSVTGQRLPYESTSGLALCGQSIRRDQLKPGDIVIRTGEDAHVIMFLEWTEDGRIRCIHESSAGVNNVTVAERDANWPYYRKLVD